MKINKIYISSFGGLKDFQLDLTDGLNVIFGNNEDGKSTVAAFIKAMFYGTGKKSQTLNNSLRQKYTPWDGSAMAGRIYFEHKNKNYCLEKEFRKSDSTDRILLRDTDLGKEVDVGDNIGQHFFGMSAAAFERSLFIGMGDFIKDGAAAGEINAKLSNIAVTGSEDTSYQKIQKTLFDAKNRIISKTGRAGSYTEDMHLYEDLSSRLDKACEDARKKSAIDKSIEADRAEYDALYQKFLSLKKIIDSEQDLKNREKLAEYLEVKKQLDSVNQSLQIQDGTTIDETFIKKVNFGLGKYEKITDRCVELQNDIQKIRESIELQNQNSPESAKQQIDKLTENINRLSKQKEKLDADESSLAIKVQESKQKLDSAQNKKAAFNPLLLALSIVLAALGGTLAYFVSLVVAAICCGIATVLLALTFIIKPKNNAAITTAQNELNVANTALAEVKANKNLIAEEINNANARINTLSSVLNANAAVKAQRQSDLNDKLDALAAEKEKQSAALDEVKQYLSRFENLDTIELIKSRLAALEQDTNKQKQLKLQLSYLSRDLGNISYELAAEKLSQMQDGNTANASDLETAKAEFQSVSDQLSQLKESITVSLTELKTSFRHSENPEDIRRELDLLKEKLTSKKEFCDTVDVALSVLEESFYEVRRGYGSELETQTQAIFSALTNGKYSSVSVSDGFDMSVEQKEVFGTRDLDYLSLGTTHQAYLSLRLAIAKLISKDDALPLFLDDSLSQYDDTRAERAMQFLKEFCQGGQGVLFTCHSSICNIAENQGIEIQKPYKKMVKAFSVVQNSMSQQPYSTI